MHAFLIQQKPHFVLCLDHLQKELSGLRTGRATPSLVENIEVSAYGSNMEIKGLASISILDSKTLAIEPWDKGLVSAIEKAIRDSQIGLSPVSDGGVLRLNMPMMTEENRMKMVKVMKEKMEEAKISIRAVREKTREQIMEKEKNKEMSEDEKFKLLDELEKLTKEYTDEIHQMGEKKEQEILTV